MIATSTTHQPGNTQPTDNTGASAAQQPLKIFIVEDERIVALDLKRRLIKLGYAVPGVAASGEQTLEQLAASKADLVLMDIHLEGALDGIDTAAAIHRQHQIPVIFLTAYSEEPTLARARATRPYGYLLKPFTERELHATIQIAVERHQSDIELTRRESRLQLAMDAAQLATWEIDPNANPAAQTFSYWSAGPQMAEVPLHQSATWNEFFTRVHEDDRGRVNHALEQLHALPNVSHEIEFRAHNGRTQGPPRWFKLYGKTFPAANTGAEGETRTVGIVQDVTDRRLAEERVQQAATVFEHTAEGILIFDARRRIDSINAAFTAITGYNAADIVGKELSALHINGQNSQFYDALWASVESTGHWQGEAETFRKNGETFQLWLNVATIRDEQQRPTHYVAVCSDISALRRAEDRLAYLAHYDPLTGLANRILVLDRLDQALGRAQRHGRTVAVMFIDLDHFKRVNDTLGHHAGDELLCAATDRLRKRLRTMDTIGRLGGDEFMVILDQIERPDQVAIVAENLMASLASPIDIGNCHLTVGASIGISLYPADAGNRDDLIRAADTAMYAAKERGRNGYAFYTPEMTSRTARYLARDQALRQALERKELRLHYQPQVSITDGKLIGVEALIRWQHPEQGLLDAKEIVPIAEESGLVIQVGEWVLREACRQARRWLDEGLPPLRLSINVSVHQIDSGRLPNQVRQALQDYALDPGCIELEITESAIQNHESSITALRELKALGISIAIDDFGTGYSCLSSLRLLPIHRIKIDQAFVRELSNNPNDQAIVGAIMAMSRQLNLQVIAEGVETLEQAEFLRAHDCGEAQGYLYGKPGSAEDIARYCRGPGQSQPTPSP